MRLGALWLLKRFLRHFTADEPLTQHAPTQAPVVILMLIFWAWYVVIIGGLDYLAWRIWWPIGLIFAVPLLVLYPVVYEVLRTIAWAVRRCMKA